jgi:ubiquinone/menaquinone biosynthesis C-methylase UbiE
MNEKHGNVEYFYSHHYSELIGNRSTGILSILWRYPHKLLEVNQKSNANLEILEIGAGEGEHLGFVCNDFKSYVMTDIDDERLRRFSSKNENQRVLVRRADATKLPFENDEFDRTIATCLLIHLNDPEAALVEWRRVTKKGGYIDVYVPCEPGLALRIFRKLFTKRKAENSGFQGYDLFMARDHLTSTHRLLELIAFVFRNDSIKLKYRPFVLRSWYLNLFIILRIQIR